MVNNESTASLASIGSIKSLLRGDYPRNLHIRSSQLKQDLYATEANKPICEFSEDSLLIKFHLPHPPQIPNMSATKEESHIYLPANNDDVSIGQPPLDAVRR